MNLGNLDEENEKFIESYKSLGFKTKTQLANEAFSLLRLKKKKEQREAWRLEAFSELSDTKPDIAFKAIDGENFAG